MRIDVWTDIYCPWCYIGKRRLERALAQFEPFQHGDQVHVHWRSYQLDPSAPRSFEGDIHDMLSKKYGMTRAKAEASHQKLTALAAADDLVYRFDIAKPGNTADAHRLVHLAATQNLADAMQERLMRGYFSEGVAIGDQSALGALAVEVGVTRDAVDDLFAGDLYADTVRDDQQAAFAIGIQGVPAFVFDQKYLVSGAQSIDVLLMALGRAWESNTG